MPFRLMSHPQFGVQTALSAHKRIQNHSLQFTAKLSIRKMKPRLELFKYSLWSAGWSHKLSTCCVNWGVTVENRHGSKNRTATQRNQGLSKQQKNAVCCLPWKMILMSPWRSFDWSFLSSTVYVFIFLTWAGPYDRLCRRNSIGAIWKPEVIV